MTYKASMEMPPRMPRLNKEQRAYQHAKERWYIFAGIGIGAMSAFNLFLIFELAK